MSVKVTALMKHILGGYGLVLRDMDTPLVATVLPSVTTVTVVSAQRIQLRVSSSLWATIPTTAR